MDSQEKNKILSQATKTIVEAVDKKVKNARAVGVLLSGGLKSSLVMELTARRHPNVTAFIVAVPGSPDYRAAVSFSKKRNFNYRVVRPRQEGLMDNVGSSLKRAGIDCVIQGDDIVSGMERDLMKEIAKGLLPEDIIQRFPLPYPYAAGFGFENLTSTLPDVPKNHLIIAHFDKFPMYYPLYHAAAEKLYKKHGITVSFVATRGDDTTYIAVLSGAAHIGVADPIFSFADYGGIKSEIIAELVNRVPLQVVALRPDIKVNKLKDLQQLSIGTLQKFTSTHTVTKYLLPDADIKPYSGRYLTQALIERKIDVAVLLPSFASELTSRGGHVIYDLSQEFPHFLFSGCFVSKTTQVAKLETINHFLDAIKEASRDIKRRPKNARQKFKEEFPELLDTDTLFNQIKKFWSHNLKVHKHGLSKARHAWHSLYPWLIKTDAPVFSRQGPEDKIITLLTSKQFSRMPAYREYELKKMIREAMKKKEPIRLLMFWEAGNRKSVSSTDTATLKHLQVLLTLVQKQYKPGLEVTVILADEHARIEGISSDVYQTYLKKIEAQLQKIGVNSVWLRSLWRRWRIRDDIIQSWIKRYDKKDATWWQKIAVRDYLEHEVSETARDIKEAQRYYVMRQLENKKIEQHFKNVVLATYAEDWQQQILPDIPTLYLQSVS